MSNHLAFATVTASLRLALQQAFANAAPSVPGALVSAMRPDVAATPSAVGANVFLYRISPNAALRNRDLATRDSGGETRRRPAAAFDLSYLVSTFGEQADLQAERLMGTVVSTLHGRPLITEELIDEVLNDPEYAYLAGSDLGIAPDRVRIVQENLSLQELERLWSSLFQTPFQLSVAFSVGVVVIDAPEPVRVPLPVREPAVHVASGRRPFVREVLGRLSALDRPRANAPLRLGDRMVLTGTDLRGGNTFLRIAGRSALVEAEVAEYERIVAPLASPPFAAADLVSGVHGVQVVHTIEMGDPLEPRVVFESNVVPFVLRPTVASVTYDASATEVTVELQPALAAGQRVALLLDEKPGTDAVTTSSYRFEAPQPDATAPTVTFAVEGVEDSTYAVRVQVDGAESTWRREGDEDVLPEVVIA